jgi:serine phosphatase RsbU (regulator of sigma subunit)
MADAPRAWTVEETAMVEQVATLTRAALETARVQVREHAIAQQLQDALQPALPDHVPGLSVGKFTQPALDEAQVGGDFYDIFALDKEVYALVLGDVSGKGLAAAQQLALIRNSLRTTLYLYRAPAQAAAALNAIVTAHDLLVGFVTVWVGVYDRATGEVVYCSCGHEPGLVRRTGGSVETLVTTGPPLGVAENAEYSESVVTLTMGDALLLYTDGVSESGPSRREMLGTEGLARILEKLPAHSDVQPQAEALVREVSALTNGVFRDDVAVLLVQRM